MRVVDECRVQLKVIIQFVSIEEEAVLELVELRLFGQEIEHNYTLEDLDEFKRNAALIAIAANEVEASYSATAANKAIKSAYKPEAY